MRQSFFSVAYDLIVCDAPMPYDLFVNSSSLNSKERYVRVFPIGEVMSAADLKDFRAKYNQLYVPENQRGLYLQGLVRQRQVTDAQKGEVLKNSAIHYLDKIFDDSKEFTTEVLAETLAGCRETVESMVEVVQDYDIQGVQNLIGELSFHDFYTYDHSINVSMYCIGILKAMDPGASKEEMINAGMGGLLHDLGKIEIPTEIINWPGQLSDEQFAMIQKHPHSGKNLIEQKGVECQGVDLDVIKRVVYEHHENFNGTGYPNKISGEQIHLYARITAVADFFDAITTKRSYHDVLSVEQAIHVMSRAVGKKIDPKIFEAFRQNVRVLIKQAEAVVELPEDFDSCRPHEELPLHHVPKSLENQNFGKVKYMDRLKPKKKKSA